MAVGKFPWGKGMECSQTDDIETSCEPPGNNN